MKTTTCPCCGSESKLYEFGEYQCSSCKNTWSNEQEIGRMKMRKLLMNGAKRERIN